MLKEVQEQLQALEDKRRQVEKGLELKQKRVHEVIEREKQQALVEAKKVAEKLLREQEMKEREFENKLKIRELELCEREARLWAETEFVNSQKEMLSRTVKLDVGGRLFRTTLTTLCSEESMLSAMFSGRHEICEHIPPPFALL